MIEADFRALPLAACAQAAIGAAQARGAEHVDVRISRQRSRSASARDARPLAVVADSVTGLGVRVLVDGVWGFAAGDLVTPESAADVAALAVAMARVAAPVARERVELAAEPVHAGQAWANPVGIDPFLVPDAEVLALLESRSATLLASGHVQRVDAGFHAFRDITYYADSAGTDTLQQRTRVAGDVAAFHITDERFDDMASCAPRRSAGLGVPRRGRRVGLGLRDRRPARAARREVGRALGGARPVRPGPGPHQPLAHHPRERRACHGARPRARVRGQLRRKQLRDAGPAGHTEVRITPHARDRRPHCPLRAVHARLRRRGRGGAVLGPRA